jgi:hypothetical protein
VTTRGGDSSYRYSPHIRVFAAAVKISSHAFRLTPVSRVRRKQLAPEQCAKLEAAGRELPEPPR